MIWFKSQVYNMIVIIHLQITLLNSASFVYDSFLALFFISSSYACLFYNNLVNYPFLLHVLHDITTFVHKSNPKDQCSVKDKVHISL